MAQSTLPRQNVESTSRSEHFWKLRCRKSARHCGAKHICKSIIQNTPGRPLWLVARSTFRSQKCKKLWGYGALLDVQIVVLRGRRKGLCTLSKVSKTSGFCSISKNDGRRGTFDEDLQSGFRVAGAVQETCSSELLGGPAADFLRGVAFWSIRSSGLLR